MKNIYLLTSNDHKVAEAQNYFKNTSITIKKYPIDFIELQSTNQEEVVRDKLEQARKRTDKSVLVDDTAFYIKKYNEFPGTITKLILSGIGLPGIISLSEDGDAAYFKTLIGYSDGNTTKIFTGEIHGTIDTSLLSSTSTLISDVFIPEGHSEALYTKPAVKTHRTLALEAFTEYILKNYGNH